MKEDDLFEAILKALLMTPAEKKTPEQVTAAVHSVARMSEEFLSLVGTDLMKRGFGEDLLYDIILSGIAISIRRVSGAKLAWKDLKHVEDSLFNTADPEDIKRMQEEAAKTDGSGMLCSDPTCEACNMVRKLALGDTSGSFSVEFPFTATTKH